jgi:uncharacterized protein
LYVRSAIFHAISECFFQLHRLAERGSYEKPTVHAILDEALFCTVAYVDSEGQPVTIPTNFVRIDDAIVVHGKSSAAYLRAMAAGARVCVTVTLVGMFLPTCCSAVPLHPCAVMRVFDFISQLDALVLARSGFHHSVNYRSVVAFGCGTLIAWVPNAPPKRVLRCVAIPVLRCVRL